MSACMNIVAAASRHHSRQVSVARKSHGQSRPLAVPLIGHMPGRMIAMKNDDVSGESVTEENVETQVNSPGLAKGQGTAIVTGAISIIFGIAYLALVQVMDMRGGELQPPPPEAFLN